MVGCHCGCGERFHEHLLIDGAGRIRDRAWARDVALRRAIEMRGELQCTIYISDAPGVVAQRAVA